MCGQHHGETLGQCSLIVVCSCCVYTTPRGGGEALFVHLASYGRSCCLA